MLKEFLGGIGRAVLGWGVIGAGVWAIGLTGLLVYGLLGRVALGWLFAAIGTLLMMANALLSCQRELRGGGPSGIPMIAALLLYLSATVFLLPGAGAAEQTHFLIGLLWLVTFIFGRGYTLVFLFGGAMTTLIFLGGMGGWRSLSPYLILAACCLSDLLVPPLAASLFARFRPVKRLSG
ncbi:MAG: hypothetical protein HYZ95_02465 [Candidatus Omnitrophica bacterium]|nr:hypothetical protein [Candidatus Omnitrophota bacterium]